MTSSSTLGRNEEIAQAVKAAQPFVTNGGKLEAVSLGEGNINDTYLVRQGKNAFVLQRLNKEVFVRPELVVINGVKVTEHILRKLESESDHSASWVHVLYLKTSEGKPYHRDDSGNIWRAQSYLENTVTYAKITNVHQAKLIGKTLGRFHTLVKDLPEASLYQPLPDFHNLPQYIKKFNTAREGHTRSPSSELNECFQYIKNFPLQMDILEKGGQNNSLTRQVIHGDPKADNFLFHCKKKESLALIDLDTVGTGLLHYDIGDCLRSCCNCLGERDGKQEKVKFDLEACRAIVGGYREIAEVSLTSTDKQLFFEAVALITFELGVRFITDFLLGDTYFKIRYKNENLHRALLQFQLVTSILQQEKEIRKIAEEK